MNTKKVLVPLAPGFEEIEAITVVDILRRAGLEVVVAGTQPGPITASRGTRHLPDCTLDDVTHEQFDMIVLPGGQPGTNNLRADQRVRGLIESVSERGGYVAAICAAPSILAAYGLLEGRAATSHPVARDEVAARAARYSEDRVVVDGPVITSRAPGTALEFALTLVGILCGQGKATEINRSVLARI
ncbi:MAG: DJ-1/PfpI family protein [Verrucomicrobiae bacterium]|nr:DJ-1/PfpI family protein [Verrucomicrobiae bacterium]